MLWPTQPSVRDIQTLYFKITSGESTVTCRSKSLMSGLHEN